MIYQYKCKKCNKTKEVEMSVAEYRKSMPTKCCSEAMDRYWEKMEWTPCKGMHSYGYKTLDGKRGIR